MGEFGGQGRFVKEVWIHFLKYHLGPIASQIQSLFSLGLFSEWVICKPDLGGDKIQKDEVEVEMCMGIT